MLQNSVQFFSLVDEVAAALPGWKRVENAICHTDGRRLNFELSLNKLVVSTALESDYEPTLVIDSAEANTLARRVRDELVPIYSAMWATSREFREKFGVAREFTKRLATEAQGSISKDLQVHRAGSHADARFYVHDTDSVTCVLQLSGEAALTIAKILAQIEGKS